MSNAVAAERCAEESFATALASTFLAHSCSAVPAGMGGKDRVSGFRQRVGFQECATVAHVQKLHSTDRQWFKILLFASILLHALILPRRRLTHAS